MPSGGVYKRCPDGTSGTPGRPACRKAHGSWWWRAEATRDPVTGKRNQPAQGGYATKEEASAALVAYLSARDSGTWADDRRTTVREWLATWLEDCRDRLEPKTLAGYQGHVENVLTPRLGHLRLRDLRRSHVEQLIRDLAVPAKHAPPIPEVRQKCTETTKAGVSCSRTAAEGASTCGAHGGRVTGREKGPGRGGRVVENRSPRTLDSYRRTLRAALAAAMRRGLVSTNVAEGRVDALPTIGRAETAWWQPEEVSAFLTAVQDDRLVALYELAAFAGLRRGELLGLRWVDVDLTGSNPGVVVSQTLSGLAGRHDCPVCGEVHTGRRIKPGPKTDAGRRWVPLVGGTVRELLAHQAAQSSERDDFGEAYSDHQLVFAMEDGTPLRPDAVTRDFEALAGLVRMPGGGRLTPIRLHDMRHGAASLLLAAGVPIELVSLILGHASPAVTRSVYAHILKGPASKGMAAAEILVRPAWAAKP